MLFLFFIVNKTAKTNMLSPDNKMEEPIPFKKKRNKKHILDLLPYEDTTKGMKYNRLPINPKK